MSRNRAQCLFDGGDVEQELARAGIQVRSPTTARLAEEAPGAYRDINRVLAVAEGAGMIRRVARLDPLIIIRR